MSNSLSSFDLFQRLKTSEIYNKISRPIIIADDIRTPENMGSIIRLGANIGTLKVIFISNKASEFKNYKINKTASGAALKTEWLIVEDFESAIKALPKDYELIAIETSNDSKDIFKAKMPENIAFVIGNEIKGIKPNILNQIETKLHIPIPGPISSLNVTHALSVALFEWFRQQS